MQTPNALHEALSNESLSQIAGWGGKERHQALLHRWCELRGMAQLALLLSVPADLRQVLESLRNELRRVLRAGADVL